jgi:hypothetical protein
VKGVKVRSVPVLTAVIIGAAAVILGCGQQHGVAAGAPEATAPAASSPASIAPACRGGGPAMHARSLTVTNADNGESLCVTRGTAVAVYLKGTPARKWAPIHASSAVLAPAANGALTLALGVTGASFTAAQAGTAVITSSRPACGSGVPPGDSAPATGTLACGAVLAFHVTVTVVR